MNLLLTGHLGRLGRAIAPRLAADGHRVRGFDLAEGGDIRDAAALARAAEGMDAIVHAAGLADDRNGAPAEVMAVDLAGAWNALLAAEAAGCKRVIHFSSGKALGMLERDPDYLPIDDDHRGLPGRAYGLAKWLSEEMCQAFTARTGIATLCLRPVAVFDAAGYARAIAAADAPRPPGAPWHLGVHIDLRDVADATAAALACPSPGHIRLLLAAADIAATRPTLELVEKYLPHVPWRGGAEYRAEPWRSLVDIGRAERVLGWKPRHLWPGRAQRKG